MLTRMSARVRCFWMCAWLTASVIAAAPATAQLTLLTPPSDVTFAPDGATYLNTCCGVAAGPVACAPASFPLPGGWGWACGAFLDSTVPCAPPTPSVCGSTSIEDGLVRVSGNSTSTLSIRALNLAYDDYDCCECPGGPYYSISWQDLLASLFVRVDIPGVPAGTPVTVGYRWSVAAQAWNEGPVISGGGNLAASSGAMFVQGTSVFGNNFDVWDTRGARAGNGTGTFTLPNGATAFILISQYVDAWAIPPPSPETCPPLPHGQRPPEHDTASARRETVLILSVNADGGSNPPPTPAAPCATPTLEFSLDIGSDTERSDPTPDGNEVFEPFDSYIAGGPPIPFPGADGFRTDDVVRGADVPPAVPGGAGAPTCTAIPVTGMTQLDLDGMDSIDFDLAALLGGGIPAGPIARFPSACVQEVRDLLISFDDDAPSHWAGTPGTCPVPVGSTSVSGATYGSPVGRDEVWSLNLSGAGLPFSAVIAPVASESAVHPSLAPDPPPDIPGVPTPQDLDDDIDALDLTGPGCGTWLYGVDHEARLSFPPAVANYGTIFQWTPAGGTVPAILPMHLGFAALSGVDIRDFELVWTEFPAGSGAFVLMLVFTVAPDDPLTGGVDESGGLNPAMLYGSYLTGTNFPLLSEALQDPIDAVANWCQPIVFSPPPPTPLCACPGNMNGTDADGTSRVNGADIQGFVGCMLGNRTLRDCRCAAVRGTWPLTAADVAAYVDELLTVTGCP